MKNKKAKVKKKKRKGEEDERTVEPIPDPFRGERGDPSKVSPQKDSPGVPPKRTADACDGRMDESSTEVDPVAEPTNLPTSSGLWAIGSDPERRDRNANAEQDILTSERLESEDEDDGKEEPEHPTKEEDAVSMKPSEGLRERQEDTSPNGRELDDGTEDQEEPSTSPTTKRRMLRPASKRKVPLKRYEGRDNALDAPKERNAPVDPLELLGTVALETALQDMDEDEEAARTLSAVGGSGSQRKGGKKAAPSIKTEEQAVSKGKKTRSCRSCGNKDVARWWSQDPSLCSACGRLFSQGSYCPICERVYRARDNIPMIQCDKCAKWIHAECEGMSQEEYLNMADDVEYFCPICRGEPPPPAKKEKTKEEPQPAPPPKKPKKSPKAPSPPPVREAPTEIPKEPTPPPAEEQPAQTPEGTTQWPPMFPPGGMPPMMHPAMLPFLAPQRVILPPSMLASVPKVIRLSIMQGRQNFANMWAMANQYLAHMSSASGSQGKTGQALPQGMAFPQIPGMTNLANPSQPGQQDQYFGMPFQNPGGFHEGKIQPPSVPESRVEPKPVKPLVPPKPKKTPKTGVGSSKVGLASNLLTKKKPAGSMVGSIANQGTKAERASGAAAGLPAKKASTTLVGKASAMASQASSVPFHGGAKGIHPPSSTTSSPGGRAEGAPGKLLVGQDLPGRPSESIPPPVSPAPTSAPGPAHASAPHLVSSPAIRKESGTVPVHLPGVLAPVGSSNPSGRRSPAPPPPGPEDGPEPGAGSQ